MPWDIVRPSIAGNVFRFLLTCLFQALTTDFFKSTPTSHAGNCLFGLACFLLTALLKLASDILWQLAVIIHGDVSKIPLNTSGTEGMIPSGIHARCYDG